MKQTHTCWTFRCTYSITVIDLVRIRPWMYTNFAVEINEVSFQKNCLKQVHLMPFALFIHFPFMNIISHHLLIQTCLYFRHSAYKSQQTRIQKTDLASVLHEVQSKSNGRKLSSCWTIREGLFRATRKICQIVWWHLLEDGDVKNTNPRKTKCWNPQPSSKNHTIKRCRWRYPIFVRFCITSLNQGSICFTITNLSL